MAKMKSPSTKRMKGQNWKTESMKQSKPQEVKGKNTHSQSKRTSTHIVKPSKSVPANKAKSKSNLKVLKKPQNIDDLMDVMGDTDEDDDDNEDATDSAAGSDDEDDEMSEAKLAEQMASLAESDPAFHAFLSKENPQLLDFQAKEDTESDSDNDGEDGHKNDSDESEGLDEFEGFADSESDQDDEEMAALAEMEGSEPVVKAETNKAKEVTKAMVKAWDKQLLDVTNGPESLSALRHIAAAFAAAVRSGDALANDEDQDNGHNDGKKRRKKKSRGKNVGTGPMYTFITDSNVHTALLSLALRRIFPALNTHLNINDTTVAPPPTMTTPTTSSLVPPKGEGNDEQTYSPSIQSQQQSNRSRKKSLPQYSKKWNSVKNLTKSFLTSLLYLLSSSQDADTQAVIFKTISSDGAARYFAAFPKLGKSLLTKCLQLWSEGENHVRIRAFLCIRSLAMSSSATFLDLCIKGMYVSHIAHSKFVSEQTHPTVVFMENCVVEICSLDCHATYRHAFTYIRQLGMHLRTAITSKKKESYASIYNWQYMRCLQVWARVINETYSSTDKTNPLAMLVYPLTQILVGTIRLVPTARYYPMRLHCVRSLNKVSAATHGHVPVATHLLEILNSTHMKSKAQHTKGKAPLLQYIVKVPKSVLGTKLFQEGVLEQLSVLLLEYLSIHSFDIAFPEFAVPIVMRVKKALGTKGVSSNRKFADQLRVILKKTEESISYILEKRAHNSPTFGPSDAMEVRKFNVSTYKAADSPLSEYYRSWLATDAARRKSLHEDVNDEMTVKPESKRKANEMLSDSDSDEEGDDENESALIEVNEPETEKGNIEPEVDTHVEEGVQNKKVGVAELSSGDEDEGEDEIVSGLPVWDDEESDHEV